MLGPDRIPAWRTSLEARVADLWTLMRPSQIPYDEVITRLAATHTEIERFCFDLRQEAEVLILPDASNHTIRQFWIGLERLSERASEGPGQRNRARYHLDSTLIALAVVSMFEEIVSSAS